MTGRHPCCVRFPSPSRSWQASSRAIQPTAASGSTFRTGEVWPQATIDYAREEVEEDPDDEDPDDEDPDRWLPVCCEGSQAAFRDMEDFIETLSDEDRADRLSIAISGRGAFRRFKDVLGRWPGELEAWYAFSDERQRGRARAWLACCGVLASRAVASHRHMSRPVRALRCMSRRS